MALRRLAWLPRGIVGLWARVGVRKAGDVKRGEASLRWKIGTWKIKTRWRWRCTSCHRRHIGHSKIGYHGKKNKTPTLLTVEFVFGWNRILLPHTYGTESAVAILSWLLILFWAGTEFSYPCLRHQWRGCYCLIFPIFRIGKIGKTKCGFDRWPFWGVNLIQPF